MLWAQNKAAVTWKERGLLGSVFGAAQVATSESFASERIFENFFQAISSYPDRMSSSKTHKWLMEPREFVHIASRHSKDTVYQIDLPFKFFISSPSPSGSCSNLRASSHMSSNQKLPNIFRQSYPQPTRHLVQIRQRHRLIQVGEGAPGSKAWAGFQPCSHPISARPLCGSHVHSQPYSLDVRFSSSTS